MFAWMIDCNKYPYRFLPVRGSSPSELCKVSNAFLTDVKVVTNDLIAQVGGRVSDGTGFPAHFLGLVPGMRFEMIEAKVEPMEMARMAYKKVDQFYPALIEDLIPTSPNGFDIIAETRDMKVIHKRLSDRLQRDHAAIEPSMLILGRMLGRFILHGEMMMHFMD